MATKTSVVLVDDLDGETPADTTVNFSLDGKDVGLLDEDQVFEALKRRVG